MIIDLPILGHWLTHVLDYISRYKATIINKFIKKNIELLKLHEGQVETHSFFKLLEK